VSGTSFFADSRLSVSEPTVTDFRYRQLRTRGDAGDPARRDRRNLCPHKESHHAGAMRLNRTAQVDTILATTVEELCCNMSTALDDPSFEPKQKILRPSVERIEFVEVQITIEHVIPISDVRLRRDQHRRYFAAAPKL
jgi:hypothetical protein